MVKLDPPAQLGMSIGEAMFTQRAIRRLRPEPVSDEDLKTLMDAASKAPSSRNSQSARFLAVRDRDRIRRFGELYREAWWAKRPAGWTPEGVPEGDLHLSAMRLADAMKDAPLVVLAVSTSPGTGQFGPSRRAEPDAGGAGTGYRIGFDHPPSLRHRPDPRAVQNPAGSRGPLLHPARLSRRPVRHDHAPPHLRDYLLRGMGQPAAVEVNGLVSS